MQIEVENLSITFTQDQSEMIALKDVSLGIEKGEFICLLGPSGCGKSTLLNTMAGFLKPTEGTVKIDGKEVVHPSISYVTIFQNYGLLPWRNVEKNVALGLETKKVPKEERKKSLKNILILSDSPVLKRNVPASSPEECSKELQSPVHLLLIQRSYSWTSLSEHLMRSQE